MSLRYTVKCDGCGEEQLYGVPHLKLSLQPQFAGASRDTHYCNSKCLSDHLHVIGMRLSRHADAYHAMPRPTPRGAA